MDGKAGKTRNRLPNPCKCRRPDGFKEGPSVFERGGKYYYTFLWVQDKTETLAYAMGDHPISSSLKESSWTNPLPDAGQTTTPSEYQGQWYLYHHNDYSPQFDKTVRCG